MNAIAESLPSILAISALIVALVSVAGAVVSTREVYLRRRAEQRFRDALGRDPDFEELAWEIKEFIMAGPPDGIENVSDQEELLRWTWHVDKYLNYLNEDDRKRIEEALYQPSIKGRANYIRNLFLQGARSLEAPQGGSGFWGY